MTPLTKRVLRANCIPILPDHFKIGGYGPAKMRVSKRLISTSIIYGGAEARLRGVPEPPPVHVPGTVHEINFINFVLSINDYCIYMILCIKGIKLISTHYHLCGIYM